VNIGTLDVRVRGDWPVPPTLGGRFAILCAILRQLTLILQIAVLTGELRGLKPDVFFVDQLSAGLPLLKLLTGKPIFFYCHFPDLLLVQNRRSLLKRLYRLPFDKWEEWSIGWADTIAVNSGFTAGVVGQTWPRLVRQKKLEVVYPCIDTASISASEGEENPWPGVKFLLSLNRFERKKNVALALRAFAALSPDVRKNAKLVIAGGYDPRVRENVAHHEELATLATELGLSHTTVYRPSTPTDVPLSSISPDVLFLCSVSTDKLKDLLLRHSLLLLYTPSNEHFGIVPLESMLRRTPVLACNDGGPTETVVDGETGWLRDAGDVRAWRGVVESVLGMSESEVKGMGRRGEERVRERFGRGVLVGRVEGILEGLVGGSKGREGLGLGVVMLGAVVALVVGMVVVSGLVRL